MSKKVRWGVLGAARIAWRRVIPAMQHGPYSEVIALASRNLEKARTTAEPLGIPKVYGSYEELLADPEIDAIYNPLPNHLHIPWTQKAMQAGKHVLCEKPFALNLAELEKFIKFCGDYPHLKVGEAFMVKSHPLWHEVRRQVQSGAFGEVRSIHGHFSYFNANPENVRNVPEWGGGGMYDIGVYPLTLSRYVLNSEPRSVMAMLERDPEMGIDHLGSALLDFGGIHSIFTCSMQMIGHQTFEILGTKKRLEVKIPYNAPEDRKNIFTSYFGDFSREDGEVQEFDLCNQYTLQGNNFSKAILEDGEVPVSLEDTWGNTAALEAIFESAKTGKQVEVKQRS
ncbi:MAG: Gfo/Idh/MocA family oxidoreductase [Bacteroidota bacterium]